MNNQEFKFLGSTMENLCIKYGIFLITWAAIISWLSQSGSMTSWIPAFLGFPIFLFGWLSRVKPAKKKIFMHCAVLFGLLAFLGGLDLLREILSGLSAFSNPYVGSSKLVLLISGALFCYICAKSFRFARLNNQ